MWIHGFSCGGFTIKSSTQRANVFSVHLPVLIDLKMCKYIVDQIDTIETFPV